MRNYEELRKKLQGKLRIVTNDRNAIMSRTAELGEKFGLPSDIANDYLTLRKDVAEADDFTLFMLASLFYNDSISRYFTEMEIKEYSSAKFEVKKLKFPLKYRMLQVSDDQWIGKITVRELMELRDAQLINYNENTQRTLRKIVAGEVVRYQIDLNMSAVKQIQESFHNRSYIPNVLTLTLPEGSLYEYSDSAATLTIRETEGFHFDMLDGYHRYIGISKEFNIDGTFDYVMELRIVAFNEDRAKHFIFQEDQKTPMKKLYSETMNQTAVPTKVIARLNNDSGFLFSGKINPNDGIINSAVLHSCINTLFCDNRMKQSDELAVMLDTASKLKKVMENLYIADKKFSKTWSDSMIIAATYVAHKGAADEDIAAEVETCCRVIENHPELFGVSRRAKFFRTDFKRLEEYLRKGEGNVQRGTKEWVYW